MACIYQVACVALLVNLYDARRVAMDNYKSLLELTKHPGNFGIDQIPGQMLDEVAAVGRTEEEYIQDFEYKAALHYLIKREWPDDLPEDFDDSDINAKMGLDLPTWDEVSDNDMKPSFLEMNLTLSKANSRDFCMPEWLPMLAKTGVKVGDGSFKDVYVVDTTCSQNQNIRLAVAKERTADGIKDSEVEFGTKIDHPYIIKVYAAGSQRGVRRMLMEAASGGDLEKKYRTLSSKALAKVLLELMVALQHLHKSNIVHADLKAEQVLLSKDCSTDDCTGKLGDLGFSTATNGC